MKLVPFVAESAQAALEQIHAQLGPNAVVISVKPLPSEGLARLWQKGGRVEVTAGLLEVEAPATSRHSPAHEIRETLAYIPDEFFADVSFPKPPNLPRPWRSIAWLESMGLLPELADRLQDRVVAT